MTLKIDILIADISRPSQKEEFRRHRKPGKLPTAAYDKSNGLLVGPMPSDRAASVLVVQNIEFIGRPSSSNQIPRFGIGPLRENSDCRKAYGKSVGPFKERKPQFFGLLSYSRRPSSPEPEPDQKHARYYKQNEGGKNNVERFDIHVGGL